ncbi:MAG: hypothetical protein IJ565_02480 [Bacilli bacterium]|nr:hypothetical protein [Bacilli bacterium]
MLKTNLNYCIHNINFRKYLLIFFIINLSLVCSLLYYNYIDNNINNITGSSQYRTLYVNITAEQYDIFQEKYDFNSYDSIEIYAVGNYYANDQLAFNLNIPAESINIDNSYDNYVIFSNNAELCKKGKIVIDDVIITIVPIESDYELSFTNYATAKMFIKKRIVEDFTIKIVLEDNLKTEIIKSELKDGAYDVYQININEYEYNAYYKLKLQVDVIVKLEFVFVFIIIIFISIQMVVEQLKELQILYKLGYSNNKIFSFIFISNLYIIIFTSIVILISQFVIKNFINGISYLFNLSTILLPVSFEIVVSSLIIYICINLLFKRS